jgi:holliday junction DNA helicase RuvA
MIHGISGKLKGKGLNYIVVDVGGVHYKIYVSLNQGLPKEGESIELFTYLHTPEGSMSLFGFFTQVELELFEALISVSGVGPKSAMAILSITSVDKVIAGIASGEADLLKRTSGIGRKTAERIIVELKDKVSPIDGKGSTQLVESDQDVFEALTSLGYPRKQAEAVLRELNPEIEDVRERLREALKRIKE